MTTRDTKNRRVAAAEKRFDAAAERLGNLQDRIQKATEDYAKAERDLAWVRQMPVDEEDDDAQPQELFG